MVRLRYFVPLLFLSSPGWAISHTFFNPETPTKVERDFRDVEQAIAHLSSLITSTATANFAIASFVDNRNSTIEIGNGTWESAGGITFTASYSNGPASTGTVSGGGFSNLTMTNSFQGPTATTASVNFPSVGASITFTLSASKGALNKTASVVHHFNNDRYWGVSVKSGTNTYSSSDVTSFGNSDLVNSVPTTFTVNPGAGQYIVWGSPTRLGTVTFFVGGFAGGFLGPQTVSVTNASGFVENYYVYTSVNANLGSTTVTTVTP